MFRAMSLGTRILAGFACVLVLTLVLGGTSLVLLRSIDASSREAANVASATRLILRAETDLVSLRRNALLYYDRNDDDARVRADRLAEDIRANLAAADRLILGQDRKALIREMRQLVDAYKRGFLQVAELKARREALIASALDQGGGRLSEIADRLLDGARASGDAAFQAELATLLQALGLARVTTRAFVGDTDDDRARTALARVAELRVAVAQLQRSAPGAAAADVGALAAALDPYEAGLRELVEVAAAGDRLFDGEMAETATRAAAVAEDLVARQNARTDELQAVALASVGTAQSAMSAGVPAALLIGALLAWVLGRAISRPIVATTATMQALSDGRYDAAIVGADRGDEIGAMARALEVFRGGLVEARRLREEQAAAEVRAAEERRGLMLRMADDFERDVGGIVSAVSSAASELRSAAETMSATAEETSRQASVVAAATEQATANVQTVAAASEELSGSIQEIGRQVATSARISDEAVRGADVTTEQVRSLAEAANRIGEVVDLIRSIASQTNLLALNATIEAARAGEAGKGFAVVANEVKSLATQTARATEDISAQVGGIQGATAQSVESIDRITRVIREMNSIASTIASAVEEQAAATQEISRNVQQAAQGTAEVAGNIVGVTRAAGEAGGASSQVLSSAEELAQLAERMRGQVDAFVARVRAG